MRRRCIDYTSTRFRAYDHFLHPSLQFKHTITKEDFFVIFRIFFFSFEKTMKSQNLDMFPHEEYALHARGFCVIIWNDSQIRLKRFSINGILKNWIKISNNTHVFGQINKSTFAKKSDVIGFFKQFFFHC